MAEQPMIQLAFPGVELPPEPPKVDPRTAAAMEKHRHQKTPCRMSGCAGTIKWKTWRPYGNDGSRKERYHCDTRLPGESNFHYNDFINDEIYCPRTRAFSQTRKAPGLVCPHCKKSDNDYDSTTKNKQVTYYNCKNCSRRFRAVQLKPGGKIRVEKIPDRENLDLPQCPQCNKHRCRYEVTVKPLDVVLDWTCDGCGERWQIVYQAKTPPPTGTPSRTTRICPICHISFMPESNRQSYCSPTHQARAEKQRQRAKKRPAIRS